MIFKNLLSSILPIDIMDLVLILMAGFLALISRVFENKYINDNDNNDEENIIEE